ncbi:MAG: response regulator transcription factor [Helicobacteraceae bacterium]|jgi:two-component system response regulator QseB|nr:response regulator transcription factor [Helicobacteraceae bacterium]
MARLLLLEDDVNLAETLVELLEMESFEVRWVSNGTQALDATFMHSYDLLLLDVNVPFVNGFELLQQLRESGDETPAIFITAMSDIASLSQGFDAGADDYIKKPFEFDELVVRISSLIRKRLKIKENIISIEEFQFHIDTNELYRDKSFIALSPVELKLTTLLFKQINTTITKENILMELSHGDEASEGALRVHINKLRKHGLPIQTVKGTGYRLASS